MEDEFRLKAGCRPLLGSYGTSAANLKRRAEGEVEEQMTRALIAVASAAVAGAVLIGAAGASTNGRSGCGARPDAHKRWEVVFGTEKTQAHAEALLRRAVSKGFHPKIEVDGCAAYEVAQGRFTTPAAAQSFFNSVKAAGFRASREDS